MDGHELIVNRGCENVVFWNGELRSHRYREKPRGNEEEQGSDDVQYAYVLVVCRVQPTLRCRDHLLGHFQCTMVLLYHCSKQRGVVDGHRGTACSVAIKIG